MNIIASYMWISSLCISPYLLLYIYTNSCSIFAKFATANALWAAQCRGKFKPFVNVFMRRFPRTLGSHPEIPQNMGVASCHQVCVTPRPVSLASQSAPPSLMYLCKLCKVYLSILIFLRIMIPWIIFLARYVRIVHILRRWLKKWQPTRRLKCASYNTVHLSDHRRTLSPAHFTIRLLL